MYPIHSTHFARSTLNTILCVLCLLALAGCGAQSTEDLPQRSAPDVGIVTLAAQNIVPRDELPGRVVAFRVAEVRPQLSGILVRRRFEEGSVVRAGQVLYEIDPESYQAAYDQAEATLDHARATAASLGGKAERYATLVKSKGISQQHHEDAQAAYRQALASVKMQEAALRTAHLNLERTHVMAPISGHIGRSMVSEGALVTAGQNSALATIQQIDPIYVDLVQPSQDVLRFKRRSSAGNARDKTNRFAPLLARVAHDFFNPSRRDCKIVLARVEAPDCLHAMLCVERSCGFDDGGCGAVR